MNTLNRIEMISMENTDREGFILRVQEDQISEQADIVGLRIQKQLINHGPDGKFVKLASGERTRGPTATR